MCACCVLTDLEESRHVGRFARLHPLAQLNCQFHVVLTEAGGDDDEPNRKRDVTGGGSDTETLNKDRQSKPNTNSKLTASR